MNKYIGGLALALVLVPAITFADVTTDNTALIQELQTELASLIQQLVVLLQARIQAETVVAPVIDTTQVVITGGVPTQTPNVVVQSSHMQSITLVKDCVAGQPFYHFLSDGQYYYGSLQMVFTDANGNGQTWKFHFGNRGLPIDQSGNPPALAAIDVGTSVNYEFSALDSSNTVVGTLSDTVVIEACN